MAIPKPQTIMPNNTQSFTIEVKGLPLTDEQRATISKALNDTLMHQLGGMDFRGATANAEAQATGGTSFGYIIGIDGSRWERITRNGDFLKNVLLSPQLDKSINVGVQKLAGGQNLTHG